MYEGIDLYDPTFVFLWRATDFDGDVSTLIMHSNVPLENLSLTLKLPRLVLLVYRNRNGHPCPLLHFLELPIGRRTASWDAVLPT